MLKQEIIKTAVMNMPAITPINNIAGKIENIPSAIKPIKTGLGKSILKTVGKFMIPIDLASGFMSSPRKYRLFI